MRTASSTGGFTGWHMLGAMLAFFGVIIGVNVTLAVMAGRSWTGAVVENSYVASQHFNERLAESRAQEALGWRSTLDIRDGEIRYALVDAAGAPVRASTATVLLRRPAYEAEDERLELSPVGRGVLGVTHQVRDGLWIVEIDMDAGLDKPFREARRVVVKGGALQ
ncbi:MAG: FixH family protein [Rhizobiaceae bacterium]|nr:FixH family protein [Rhizobiaceae bacterium]